MQARYYDPAVGRFLSVDPVAPTAGNAYDFGRYVYVNNNPINHTDPSGKCLEDLCIGEAIVACAATPCGAAVVAAGAAVVAVLTVHAVQNTPSSQAPSAHNESQGEAAPLPGGLVGVQDGKSGQQGGRINNGPLAPSHGGTGDSAKDFETLTGGKSAPAPADKGYPEGTMVGENGISHRPATDQSGPRIDIPANGSKPAETLHYPKPPPPPDKPGA